MDSTDNSCKLSSDAWIELQAFKTRQLNRRERLNRHRDLINSLGSSSENLNNTSSNNNNNNRTQQNPHHNNNLTTGSTPSGTQSGINQTSSCFKGGQIQADRLHSDELISSNAAESNRNALPEELSKNLPLSLDDTKNLTDRRYSANTNFETDLPDPKLVECLLLLKLCDVALKLPIDSKSLHQSVAKVRGFHNTPQALILNLLQKFAHQELITIDEALISSARKSLLANGPHCRDDDDESCIYVMSADHSKLVELDKTFGPLENIRVLFYESKLDETLGATAANDCDQAKKHIPVPIQTVRKTASSSSFNRTNLGKSDESIEHSDVIKSLSDSLTSRDNRLNRVHQTEAARTAADLPNQLDSAARIDKVRSSSCQDDVESLLSLSSMKERESKKLGEELLELLSKPTAKERNLLESFRSADGYQVQEFCPKGTKGECMRNSKTGTPCSKLHFKKIIAKHTEESLGDCSFLNTCFHMDSCKYVHYEVDYDEDSTLEFEKPANARRDPGPSCSQKKPAKGQVSYRRPDEPTNSSVDSNDRLAVKKVPPLDNSSTSDSLKLKRFKTVLYPPQWIQCDLRYFDMSLLGKFSVVMADPPWDIHMELPYGTMSDDEMRKLNIPALQDEGVIFLWVTGRAMELGRECLALWGYERCDEIIWVKTNQLQRIIRTGRTGHWLNHGKEHCLVGVKGNPKDVNRGLDCDVIVAEVRATSHKPDEIYGIIERLSPGTRKIELFGRQHNVQPNWITLGNQLNGVHLIEPNLINAFKEHNLPFQTIN